MLCLIDDYYLADGTLAGGRSLTGLRIEMQRIFDVVQPLQVLLNPTNLITGSYTLAVGMAYRIVFYADGDDFTGIGGTNVTGAIFIVTAGVATWNASTLQAISPLLLDRNKRKVDITFSVQRVQDSINEAEDFCLIHEATIPRTGDIKLITSDPGASAEAIIALVVNGALVSFELVRQIGSFTEHSYHISGAPIFSPTPGVDKMLMETGDFMLMETSDKMLLE